MSRAFRGRRPETPRTQPLRIGVPLGTVVKRKRGGALLGELTVAGQTLVVARGGKGGLGVVKPKESQQTRSKFIEQVCLSPHYSSAHLLKSNIHRSGGHLMTCPSLGYMIAHSRASASAGLVWTIYEALRVSPGAKG